jgi:stage V sporulation protein G
MEITEVKVFPIQEEKLKAFVSIVFDHCFMVNDIKIIQGRDGLFISMPSRKKKNGEFKDVAHPLNNETRRMIEEKVLAEYDHALQDRGEPPAERGERALRVSQTGVEEPMDIAAAAVSAPVPEKSLEEIEEMHLRDSFWTV